MSESSNILVLALGNPLCGDDGVGATISGQLKLAAIPLIALRQSQAGIVAEVISEPWRAVIIVDAEAISCSTIEEKNLGAIKIYDLHRDPLPPPPLATSSHGINLSQEIALLRELSALPECAALVTIVGEAFDLGTGLSPIVTKAIPEAVRKIISLVRDFT